MMRSLLFRDKLRTLSWAVFLLAFAGPALWAWSEVAAFERANPGPGCGMPILAIYLLALSGTGVLSLVAGGLGGAAFVRVPKPRPRLRIVELAVLFAPAILCAGVLVAAFVS